MFNFNLQNKAFEELNAEQFRVVYFLNNTLSMVNKTNNTPNNNIIEMYKGYMMDKLGLSVRMLQYHIKTLEQLEYIKVVRPIGRNARKQPNKITINNAIDCALSENNTNKTTNDAINGAMDCTPNKNKIINNNNTSILEHKDLVRIVTEDKKEKNNKKEKVSEMELNDKVTSTQVHPSSLNEDNKSSVSDKNVYIPKNTDSSITSPSEDDMDIDTYTSMNLEKRGIKERKITSTVSANKAAGDLKNTSMDNLSTSVEKTQPDTKEVAKTESEAKIASIMSNIELDKEGMLKAKSQMQFDAYFDDFKSKLSNLQHLVSEEAYKNYRKIQGKWWKATVKYLKYYKDPKKPQQHQQPTTVEMEYYQYHLESMFIAQSVDDMNKAINQMSNWFEKMNGTYSSSVMEKYEEMFAADCARVAKTNSIFKEWQNKATGEAEAA